MRGVECEGEKSIDDLVEKLTGKSTSMDFIICLMQRTNKEKLAKGLKIKLRRENQCLIKKKFKVKKKKPQLMEPKQIKTREMNTKGQTQAMMLRSW